MELIGFKTRTCQLELTVSDTSGCFQNSSRKTFAEKRSKLDPDTLGNNRPVSDVFYLSTLIERAVADKLHAHLDGNNTEVKFLWAYRSNHNYY